MRHRMNWTESDDAKLLSLLGEGAHVPFIAMKLDRTKSAVSARAKRLGRRVGK